MKTHARILAAVLGAWACASYLPASASDPSTNRSTGHGPPPPVDVIPSDIYDPTGLVSRGPRGQLVRLATGFKFTEGPAADRRGNVFFTDQPNDRIYRWDAGS